MKDQNYNGAGDTIGLFSAKAFAGNLNEMHLSEEEGTAALEGRLHELEKELLYLENLETSWGEQQKSLVGRIYSAKCHKKLKEIDQLFFNYDQFLRTKFKSSMWKENLFKKMKEALSELEELIRIWNATVWVGRPEQ